MKPHWPVQELSLDREKATSLRPRSDGRSRSSDLETLPSSHPVAFNGVVVDENGKALPDVHIDHSGDLRVVHQTDTAGKFDFQTTAPAVVFRKDGYKSVFAHTDSGNLHIIMSASIGPEFPDCQAGIAVDSLEGWGASFAFPRIKGVTPSAQVRDSDYGARGYFVGKGKNARGVQQGSGPMWGGGMPLEPDVWQSSQYQESTFRHGTVIITDARGQLKNGNRWRTLGTFGETASYSDVEPATADILDKFLDGACWKTESSK